MATTMTDTTPLTLADPARALRYRPQVDALRAVAVVAVMLHHFIPDRVPGGAFVHWGGVGVRLFFTISGYLITNILWQEKHLIAQGMWTVGAAARRFYMRRFLRIFPVFYLVVAVTAWLDFSLMRSTFGWHATYLSNVWVAQHGWVGPSWFWSLAVEEQFYLLWPWVILLVPRHQLRRTCVGAIILAVLYRLVVTKMGGWLWATVMMPSCLDTLGAGALLAVWRREYAGVPTPRLDRGLKWLATAGLVSLLGLYSLDFGGVNLRGLPGVFGDFLWSLVFVWLVDQAARGVTGPARWMLNFRPLQYVGRISYGVYLLHCFVSEAYQCLAGSALGWMAVPSWFNAGIYMVSTVALAALSWHLFEKPINDLKRYFPYQPAPRPAASAAAG